MPVIQFKRVVKLIDNHRTLLDSIDLDVSAGEIFALIGANGSGKTTLIKTLLNLVDIDEGEIQLNHLPHREIAARRGVAYLPEQFRPPYFLNGREFLVTTARLSGIIARDAAILELCNQLGLDVDVLSHTIGKYSKGMGQKLGLIASLLCGEKVLVLDEPMSGLDAVARVLLKSQLTALRDAGRTVFFSTHLLNDAEQFCDRIGVLDRGQLHFVGTPEQFRETYSAETVELAYLACLG